MNGVQGVEKALFLITLLYSKAFVSGFSRFCL